jgi:hypothetical protein
MVSVYEFSEGALPQLAAMIERSLGIRFELHESDMRGGEYYLHQTDAEQIILQLNRDNGDTAEEDFADVPVLLYIEGKKYSAMGVGARLGTKARLLRTEQI